MEEFLALSYFHVVQPINILTKAILQLHFKTLDTYKISSELYDKIVKGLYRNLKSIVRVSFRGGRGGAFAPPWLWLAPPWEFCSDSESIQVF